MKNLTTKTIIVALLTFLIIFALANRPTCNIRGIQYKIVNDTTAYVLHYNGSDTLVKIPDSIKYDAHTYIIKRIERHAFSYNKQLYTIILPATIQEIGSGAFMSCTSLTHLKVANTLQVIGDYSFMGCTSLEKLTLPSSIQKIKNKSFLGCSHLVVTLECPNAEIHEAAFQGCYSVDSTMVQD